MHWNNIALIINILSVCSCHDDLLRTKTGLSNIFFISSDIAGCLSGENGNQQTFLLTVHDVLLNVIEKECF